MKISPQWIREFVDLTVDDRRLAEDLTAIGIAVEGISREGASTVFEMEIGTNRPDAMNHYGVAREAAAFYGMTLKALETSAAKPVERNSEPNAAVKRSSTQNQPNGTGGAAPSRTETTRPAASPLSDFELAIEVPTGCAP